MQFSRTSSDVALVAIRPVALAATHCETLYGDNRPLMRHTSGAIHAALIERLEAGDRMSLFGAERFGEEMKRLAGPISSPDSDGDAVPATDSNQNGVYIAYVQHDGNGDAGFVTHVPDPFGDPAEFRVHGPLTPAEGRATNSFLQASRAFNSVVYGWRDEKSGALYLGVSADGVNFPAAKCVSTDKHIRRGPATGIHGDYAIFVYETTNPDFAPADSNGGTGAYYVWSESGDGGETWSEPQPLFPNAVDLPRVSGYSLAKGDDLRRSEVSVAAIAPAWDPSVQLLAWANVEDAQDSRVFVLTTAVPTLSASEKGDWAGADNSVGLLAFKPIAVGGDWSYSITNRSLFHRSELSKPYAGRTGRLYKYSALPGTPIRVITYVDKAPRDSDLEDQLAVLVSTNKGDSFEHESVFGAAELKLGGDADLVISNSACCFADANGDVWADLLVSDAKRPEQILHATLPIGINAQGLDATLSW